MGLRFIDVRKKLVLTGSVPLGDLWPAGCWNRTGVDVVAAGYGWGLYTTLIILGGEFPFIYRFVCVRGVLVGDYFRLSQVSGE